jgi:hypothetical protein
MTALVMLIIACVVFASLLYIFFQWWKHRNREEYSLKFIHLLVALPKDNEIKVDAAEQMFAGLHALKQDGWFAFMKAEEMLSIELVALHEDIKFYITCPDTFATS